MRSIESCLNGVAVIGSPEFSDSRGSFSVTYEEDRAAGLGMDSRFVQDNKSVSCKPGTIRGIHLQLPPDEQGKLVRVVRGRISDLVVDLRPDSPTFGQHALFDIDAESGLQVWVPRGFGHGFCTTEPDTEVFYKVDAPYRPESERTLAWDDPALAIDWPLGGSRPMLSEKDGVGLSFEEVLAAIRSAVR